MQVTVSGRGLDAGAGLREHLERRRAAGIRTSLDRAIVMQAGSAPAPAPGPVVGASGHGPHDDGALGWIDPE